MVLAETFFTANWEFVIACAIVGLLFWKRTGRIETKMGSLSVGVEAVNRQVNHVKDPDTEPTLRDMVKGALAQLEAAHIAVDAAQVAANAAHGAANAAHLEAAAAAEHSAATRVALDDHLRAHAAAEAERKASRPGASGG